MTLDDIWNHIDESNLVADAATRKVGLEVAIDRLKQCIASGDVRAWYPLGYAFYCHPNRKEIGSSEAFETVASLTAAIRNDVEKSLSRLYLGFHYFDCRDFQQAKRYAELVDEHDLDETMAIRLHELFLCITIMIEGLDSSRSAIERYSRYILTLRDPAVPPLNLINILEEQLRGKAISRPVEEALRKLDFAFPVLGQGGFSRLLDQPTANDVADN